MVLKTGSVNETVTVTTAPTALETETSSRGQVIGTREVEIFLSMAVLTPTSFF